MLDTSYLTELQNKHCDGMTESELDYFNERSAIYEFDAGMERRQAEELAMHSVLARRSREEMENERAAR